MPEQDRGAWDFQSAFDHAPIGMALTDLFGTTLFDLTHPEEFDTARAACKGLRDGPELTAVLGVRLCDGAGTWVAVTVSTATVLPATAPRRTW